MLVWVLWVFSLTLVGRLFWRLYSHRDRVGGVRARSLEDNESKDVVVHSQTWADDAAAALPELPNFRAGLEDDSIVPLAINSTFHRDRGYTGLKPRDVAQWHPTEASTDCEGKPVLVQVTLRACCCKQCHESPHR